MNETNVEQSEQRKQLPFWANLDFAPSDDNFLYSNRCDEKIVGRSNWKEKKIDK